MNILNFDVLAKHRVMRHRIFEEQYDIMKNNLNIFYKLKMFDLQL